MSILQADKLLSMDYQQSLDRIISRLPPSRQVFLFSATFPVSIKGFMVRLWVWHVYIIIIIIII